jgi:hypothetical protein
MVHSSTLNDATFVQDLEKEVIAMLFMDQQGQDA